MNETWDAIFSAITPFLSVLLAIGAIPFFLRWRRHSAAVWAVFACSLLALIWRWIYELQSTRYAMFLVLPAVVSGCYGIWHLHAFFPRRCKKAVKYLQILLVVAVPLIFLAKSWNFSPYENSLKELAAIAKEDAKNYPDAGFTGVNIHDHRFAYYSGLKQSDLLNKDITVKQVSDLIFLKSLSYIIDFKSANYFIIQNKNFSEKDFTSELSKCPGTFTKLGERFINCRKNRKYILFRYCPPENSGNISNQIQTEYMEGNLFINGDFENVKPLPEHMRNFCLGKRMNFFTRKTLLIPDKTTISWLGDYYSQAEVEAVTTGALDGKYSVRMKNKSRLAVGQQIKPGNYQLSMVLKAVDDSVLKICIFLYNPSYFAHRCLSLRKIAKGNDHWQYKIVIPRHVQEPGKHFMLVFSLESGEILLDNVCLQKLSQ